VIRTVVQHPQVGSFLYAGTDEGVFTSEDNGITWSIVNDGPANVRVDQLFWIGNNLHAATYGRGMFRANVVVPLTRKLTVSKGSFGSGPVTSNPAGIVCGSACSASFPTGSQVTLTATPNAGSAFHTWSSADMYCGNAPTCVVRMNSDKTIQAIFVDDGEYMTVQKSGTGSGPVISSPSGISCGSRCTGKFGYGTAVTLTAAPNSGSAFGGWSGDCSGSGTTCVIGMNGSKTVTATFHAVRALQVAKAGGGAGNVASSPGGISCGSTCSGSFLNGASVTLTATPSSGSTFGGWSGACSSSSTTCIVAMNADKAVTATFRSMRTLTVLPAGSGAGLVASTPAGINCGSTCSAALDRGTNVTLTATPFPGSIFGGWSGACSGTSLTCPVNMTDAQSVTATFIRMHPLELNKAGTGSGPVSSSPAGIACGSACNASVAAGTAVTLTATANSGSLFMGWSGGCTGVSTTCMVTMDGPKSVTATFQVIRVLTVTRSGAGAGTIASAPAGILCGSACNAAYGHSTTVTLSATAEPFSSFTGWSGACSGSSPTCTLSMTEARSVTATFTRIVP
jgi:hypothetical protein